MYLPKSCGNTSRVHRSLVLAGALGCGCTTVAGREETHTIRAHWASALCRPSDTAAATFDYELEALGDFPPGPDTHESLRADRALVVPGSTRAVALTATSERSSFLGLGTAGDGADMDVSLWPAGDVCELSIATAACAYPGTGGSAYGMGVSADGRTLLIAGGDASRDNDDGRTRDVASGAATVDLATSRVTCLAPDRALQVGRAGATVTPLGAGLLVAGGYDPESGGTPLDTAELFDPVARAFATEPISLRRGRAHHGAVTLASGEVLLVGGVEPRGAIADRTLVAIAAEPPTYRTGYAEIEPRVDPRVLRLSDDRIFIGGGTDGGTPPVARRDLLFLDAGARRVERSIPALACEGDQAGPAPTATVDSAFAAMPGGGVLAVGGCTVPLDGSTLECDDHCGPGLTGCPSSEVFFVDADGGVVCCGSGRTSCSGPASPDGAPAFDHPVLIGGEDGRPWLVTTQNGARVLRRFDPWSGGFEAPSITTPRPLTAAVRADAGLLVAIDACDGVGAMAPCPTTSVYGFRHGLRGPYFQAVAPLLLTDTDGVVLDRAPGASPSPGAPASAPWRNPSNGAVELTAASSLLLTDTTYADVDVVLHVLDGAPPEVHLAGKAFGGSSCAWPVTSPGAPYDAELTRRGGTVTLSIDDRTRSCAGPSGRVTISVVARSAVTVGSIAVKRIAL